MKKHIHATAVLVLAAAAVCETLASPGAEAASPLYVDQANPSCSNSGTGTQSQPFCAIAPAAAAATAGQTVIVNSGTYNEDVTPAHSGAAGAPITFGAASGASVTISGGTNGFTISGKSNITVQGFTITNTSQDGILATSNSSAITISNNHVSFAGKPVSGQTARGINMASVTQSLVAGNQTDHNSAAGISLGSGTTTTEVRGNVSFSNAEQFQRQAAGIESSGSGNTLDGNICYSNEDSGISFFTGANNNLVFNNLAFNNGDHGIDNLNASGQRIFNNSTYHNVTAGINVEGTSSGATLANNISVDNGINSPRTVGDIRVDSTSVSNTSIDYDLVFLHQASTLIEWGGRGYTRLSDLTAATGQEAHGIQADPQWDSTSLGGFHLLEGSPGIDSATSAPSGEPATDLNGSPRVDDPLTTNTGAGPRTYDDRGAYEFQPGGILTATATPGLSPTPITTPTVGASSTPTATPTLSGSPTPTPTPGGPPVSFVQGAVASTGSRVASVTVALSRPVAQGDLLVGWFDQYDSTGQVHISDSVNGAWTRGPAETFTSGKGDVALYYFANSAAAPSGLTITISADASTYLGGTAADYAGVAASGSLDQAVVAKGKTTAADSGSTAAVGAGELVFAGLNTGGSPSGLTPGSSQGITFTTRSSNSSGSHADADILSSAAGAQNGRFTLNAATDWYAVAAVFRPAASDPAPTATPTSQPATATPTSTATAVASATPTTTPTSAPVASATPTATSVPAATATATPTVTPTAGQSTATPTATAPPPATPTPTTLVGAAPNAVSSTVAGLSGSQSSPTPTATH